MLKTYLNPSTIYKYQNIRIYPRVQEKIFEKIIAPHKGKYIIIDFWATSCGPCVGGIKSSHALRQELKNENIAFVFITDERSSPLDAYNKWMKDTYGHKHRISADDWNKLAALFNVNSIPRYMLIDDKGKIINDRYEGWYNLKGFKEVEFGAIDHL